MSHLIELIGVSVVTCAVLHFDTCSVGEHGALWADTALVTVVWTVVWLSTGSDAFTIGVHERWNARDCENINCFLKNYLQYYVLPQTVL